MPWKKGKAISLEKKVSYLKHTPFFQYLTAEAMKEFSQCFPDTIRSRPGKTLTLDPSTIYVVAEGEVDLSTSYPVEGKKVEARGYLCRKRPGDIVNIYQAKQDVERKMTVNSRKIKDFAEDIVTVGSGDTDILLLCGDMDALDRFNKAHPELSKPFEAICTSQIEDLLLTIPFLQEVTRSKLGVFATMCRYEAFDSGEIVFEEDSQASKLFLVLSGLAKVVAKDMPSFQSFPSSSSVSAQALSERSVALQRSFECSDDRKTLDGTDEITIAELKSGDYFGETALVFNIDRTCSVKTVQKSLFVTVHKTDFENFLKICPIKDSLTAVIKKRMVSKFSSLGIPFLAGITEDMLSSLAISVSINEIPRDQVIFRQGDMGDKFYIVVHGSVKVETVTSKHEHNISDDNVDNDQCHGGSKFDGEQATEESIIIENNLGTLGPGQYFGEMALVVGQGLRSATVTSTQKSILLSIDKDSFKRIFGSNNQVLAEFELRVLKSSANLKHILAHSLGIASFRQFLENEHAGENLDFWLATEDFIKAMNATNEPDLRKTECLEKAKQIFVTFCADYADRQVNLPHKMLAEIDSRIKDEFIEPDLFDASRNEIYRLMEKDKFGRYKKSEDFNVRHFQIPLSPCLVI